MKEKFDITGMSCSACSARIQNTVSKTAGVKKAEVNLLTETMQVDFDESKMLFEEYCVSYDDTLTLAAPKKCSAYKWILTDPDNYYAEITPVYFNGGTNTERIYSMYIEKSGLKCGKTYRLLLAVFGEQTKKWHYCAM